MFGFIYPILTSFDIFFDYGILLGNNFDGIDMSSQENDNFLTMWYVLPFYRFF